MVWSIYPLLVELDYGPCVLHRYGFFGWLTGSFGPFRSFVRAAAAVPFGTRASGLPFGGKTKKNHRLQSACDDASDDVHWMSLRWSHRNASRNAESFGQRGKRENLHRNPCLLLLNFCANSRLPNHNGNLNNEEEDNTRFCIVTPESSVYRQNSGNQQRGWIQFIMGNKLSDRILACAFMSNQVWHRRHRHNSEQKKKRM